MEVTSYVILLLSVTVGGITSEVAESEHPDTLTELESITV